MKFIRWQLLQQHWQIMHKDSDKYRQRITVGGIVIHRRLPSVINIDKIAKNVI